MKRLDAGLSHVPAAVFQRGRDGVGNEFEIFDDAATRWAVSSFTEDATWMTRETVALETPACSATVRIVKGIRSRAGFIDRHPSSMKIFRPSQGSLQLSETRVGGPRNYSIQVDATSHERTKVYILWFCSRIRPLLTIKPHDGPVRTKARRAVLVPKTDQSGVLPP